MNHLSWESWLAGIKKNPTKCPHRLLSLDSLANWVAMRLNWTLIAISVGHKYYRQINVTWSNFITIFMEDNIKGGKRKGQKVGLMQSWLVEYDFTPYIYLNFFFMGDCFPPLSLVQGFNVPLLEFTETQLKFFIKNIFSIFSLALNLVDTDRMLLPHHFFKYNCAYFLIYYC